MMTILRDAAAHHSILLNSVPPLSAETLSKSDSLLCGNKITE